jgi:hypothetical protein
MAALYCAPGVSYDHAEYFDQVDDAQVMQLVAVNVVAITKVRSKSGPTAVCSADASAGPLLWRASFCVMAHLHSLVPACHFHEIIMQAAAAKLHFRRHTG